MIKTKKGQIVILDVLFAVVIIILMFFLLMKLAEVQVYKINSDKQIEKLNNVGTLAFKKALNNPQINCKVVDSVNSFYLPGTIQESAVITKKTLGIPGDYNCSFLISGVSISSNACNQVLTDTNAESYNVDFNVITCSGNYTKQNYFKYITGDRSPSSKQATLKIWRS
ncbi:MAG: hypothetical protein WCX82_03090 [archaeon]|jgi:hypothetical protein